jgi:hypothetical protein
MLVWAFNKNNKSFKLCGTYETLFWTDRMGCKESSVYINECDYELPKDVVDAYFSDLLFNPFTEYKFIVNKEKYEKYNSFGDFPTTYLGTVCIVDDNNKVLNDRLYSQSNNPKISILEKFFECIGYKVEIYRLNYNMEKEMKEKGYEPVYYYGSGRGCALFVKKV